MQFKNIAAILLGITASGAIANPVAAEGIVARDQAAQQAEQAPAAEQHWGQDWNNNGGGRYRGGGGYRTSYGGGYGYGRRGGRYGGRGRRNLIDCNQCQDDNYDDDDNDNDWDNQDWQGNNGYRRNYGRRGGQGGYQIDQCGQDWNYQQCRWY